MERNYCTAEGRVTQRYIDYMAARARGGVGLQYTEATYVDPRGKGRDAPDGAARRRPDPASSRGSSRAVHRHGGVDRTRAQLRRPRRAAVGQRPRVARALGGALRGRRTASCRTRSIAARSRRSSRASAMPPAGQPRPGATSSASTARTATCCAQFLSPWCNKRDDEYGGDLAGRMRFPLEVDRGRAQGGGQHAAGRLPDQRRRAPGQRPHARATSARSPRTSSPPAST